MSPLGVSALQNHGMVTIGKDHCKLSCPGPLLNWGHLKLDVQVNVQLLNISNINMYVNRCLKILNSGFWLQMTFWKRIQNAALSRLHGWASAAIEMRYLQEKLVSIAYRKAQRIVLYGLKRKKAEIVRFSPSWIADWSNLYYILHL